METAESKKGSLEDLSKEDLIKKCKNLISLAQKAKFSKEALQQENSNLMKQLNESRNNNVSNQLLEKLTEEKLTLVTKIEDLKVKNVQLERKIEQYEQESCAFHDRIVLLETENTSFTRQVKRLTDENEQLISDLSALEEQIVQLQELGTEQKEQLLKLESSSKNSLDEIEKLTKNIKTKDERIIELSQELQALKIISNASASNKECDKYIKEINQLNNKNEKLTKQFANIENTNEKLKEKVTLYHTKLKKFALTSKQIKEEKNHILSMFKAYTDQIIEWKEQLHTASTQLIKSVKKLQDENDTLKKKLYRFEQVNQDLILREESSLGEIHRLNDILKHSIKREEGCKEECQRLYIKLEQLTKEYEELKIQMDKQISPLNQELLTCKENYDLLKEEIAFKDKIIEEHKNKEEINQLNEALKQYREEAAELTLKNNQLNEELHKIKNICTESERVSKETINKLHEELSKCKEDIVFLELKSIKEHEMDKDEISRLNEALKQYEHSNEEVLRLTQKNKELESELTTIKNRHITTESTLRENEELVRVNNKLNEELSKCKEDIVSLELRSIKEHENDKQEINRVKEALKQYEHSNEELLRLTHKNEELESELATIKNMHIATESISRDNEELVIINSKLQEELSKCKEDMVSLELKSKKEHEKDKEEISRLNEAFKQYEHSNEEVLRLTHKNEELESELATIKNMHITTESISGENEELVTINNKLHGELSKCKEDIASLELKSKKEHEKDKEEISRLNEALKQYEQSNKEVSRLTLKNEELESELATIKNMHIATESISRDNEELVIINSKLQEELSKCKEDMVSLELKSKKEHEKDKEEISRLNEAFKQYEHSNEEVLRLTHKNEELESELATIKNLHIATESISGENKEIVTINNKLQEELSQCKEDIVSLELKSKKEHEKDKEEISRLNEALKQYEQSNKEVSRLTLKNEELESEIATIKNKHIATESTSKENEELVAINNKLREEIASLKKEIERTVDQMKQSASESEKKYTTYKEEIDKLNEALKVSNIFQQKDKLKEKCSQFDHAENSLGNDKETPETRDEQLCKCKEQIDLLEEAIINKESLIEQLKKYENTDHLLAPYKEEINKLNAALKQSDNMEKQFAEKSSEVIVQLSQSNKELENECSRVTDELNLIRNNSNSQSFSQTDDHSLSGEEIDLKRENAELLREMNQMNQALKERGEIISKLEAHCEEVKKKLQLYESQASKNVDTISEKEETIKTLTEGLNTLRNDERSKEEEIANLKAEIEALKDKFNNMDMNYAESDVMSSSTISRCEEVNRLKDLEGPWEERYGKLRTLAIKLKAKIREQTNTVTSLEKEREELLKKHSNSLKTIQTLQTQIDNLQDNLDKVSAENQQYLTKLNSVAESISKDKQQLVSNEEIISKLNKEVEKLNNDKKSVENWKKQVSAKVQTLRKELEAKNLLIKEAESKISKLEDELEDKSKQLKVEQESHKQTRTALDQLGSECKKNSVLNLEMQDYERSVKELSQKIDKQKTEINNLQTQLDMQKSTVNALREQNKTLEERIQDQEKIGNSSSLEVNTCKKTIMNLEDQLQHKEEKVSDLTKLLETARFENEELSTELTKVIAEHQKSLGTVKAEREQLRTQVLTLQQTLRDTQDVLKLRDDELSVLKDDYETYKVRAQSVLKKNQNRDLGLEEKLNEELATVKSQNAKLSSELEEISKKLENERTKGETLSREREALTRKLEELESEVNELTNYSEQLGLMHQKAINEHVETVRNLKVHAETLSQCYRQQLSEQEARHNREIIELQSRIDKAPSPVETAPVHPSMPREEGEGSESVESNPPPSVHPIPLERLLDSKSDDEVVRLRKQLSEQESKVVHLTALLSDTEQDFAKHVQMNKVLKEEIRRQQRSVEREKHAENLEYLKNVVFKFVTLNSGDERTRLVPVLNTILKLSPEETQKLTMVAKGDPGTKGWSSYLPMWPSPSKPQ